MVFHDLSSIHEKKANPWQGASVSDRVLAFFIDILLLSPFLQLVLVPFSKKIEIVSLTAPDSMELMALMGISGILVVALVAAFQTLCWTFWGATPGKYFLKLRVVSIRHGEQRGMPWGQALLRSLVWCLEFALLGIPFLEVLSHHRRRPLHDRASETSVISLKNEVDRGPHPIETQFVRQAMLFIVLLFGIWIFFGVGKFYRMAMDGDFRKEELLNDQALCSRISDEAPNRVDEALALFLVGEVSDECVEKEIDFVLWNPSDENSEVKSWALLAKGIISRDSSMLSTEYLKKSCDSSDGEACDIATKMLDEKSEADIAGDSLTAKVLQLENLERHGQFTELAKQVNAFPSGNFKEPLVGYLLRAFWSDHKIEEARGVFEAQNLNLDIDSKKSLAAWMCLQELDLGCESSLESRSCDVVARSPATGRVEVVWAQIKLGDCRQSPEPTLEQYHEIMTKRPDFRALLQASVKETGWASDRRAAQLENLAKKSRGAMQSFAVHEWTKFIRTEKQLRSVFEVLESQNNHDWKWQSNVLRAFQRAYSMKEYEVGFEFGQLLRPQVFVKWNLGKELVVTAYKSDQKKWAYDFWTKQFPSGLSQNRLRAPASSDSTSEKTDDWVGVENALKKMKVKE
jgi:uncharacterized RDD family membrane protein YckC